MRLAFALASIVASLASGAAPAATPDVSGTPLAAASEGAIPVAIVLTEDAVVIDFGGPYEAFRVAKVADASGKEVRPFKLYTVGDAKKPVRLSGGMTAIPDYTFDDAPTPRVVVVGAQKGSRKMSKWLEKVAADKSTDVLMSVCTGAYQLADIGLLDGKPATTHHSYFDDFAQRFPKVQLQRGPRFVRSDAHILTSGGLTSGIDLALHVVELYYGPAISKKTAEYLEYHGFGEQAAAPAASP
jgi:transcriptional regulator GlxA family with amidase domain